MSDTRKTKAQLISELHSARDRITELEAELERLRSTFEGMPEAVALINAEGKIIYESPSVVRIGGRPPQELEGTTFTDYLHPDDLKIIERKLPEVIASPGITPPVAVRFRHASGAYRWVEITVNNLLADPRVKALVCNFRDITAKKEVEKELIRITKAIESSGEAIGMSDPQGHHFYQNPAFTRLFGHTTEELATMGGGPLDYADPEIARAVFSTIMAGNPWTGEVEMRSKDGRRFPVLLHADAIKDDSGEIIGLIGVHTNISALKRAEETVRQSEQNYRLLFESTLDGLLVLDGRTFRVLLANETAARIFGFDSAQKGIGLDPLDFLHPDERERAVRVIAQDMFEKDLHDINEFRALTRDGREIWIEAVGKRILYQGEPAGLISLRDITDRKQAEHLINIERDLAQALSTALQLDEGLHLCVEAALLASRMDCGGIWLLDEKTAHLDLRYQQSLPEELAAALAHYPIDAIGGRLVQAGKPVYSRYGALGTTPLDEIGVRHGLKAVAIVPLVYEEKAFGALSVVSRSLESVPPFTRKTLELIVGQMSSGINSLKDREALRRSELRFRTIFENANDEIVLLDQNGVILDRNKRGEDLLGYRPEEVIGKKFTELRQVLSIESAQMVRELFGNATIEMGKEVPWIMEIHALHKNGTPVILEASSSVLEREGNIEGLIVILRDITERKRVEEQILQGNRHLAALNEIAQTISRSADLDAILDNALAKMVEILNIRHGAVYLLDTAQPALILKTHRGLPRESLAPYDVIRVGEGILGNISKLRETVFIASLPDMLSHLTPTGKSFVTEYQLRSAIFTPLTAKDELLGFMCVLTEGDRAFTDEERELVGTIGHQISTAIENARLMEASSRAKALEELDRLRTALLASVSHELRTPLTSIKGLSSSLVQPDIQWDPETQQEFLRIIDHESDILTHIVNDLMEMSQIEAGIMRLEKTRSTVGSIVRQIKDHLDGLVQRHRFEVRIPDDLPSIYVDEIRMGEVITNLVQNAVSYSEPGTPIILEAHRNDGEILVSVTDQGIGIGPEHIGKIFDRFYRLESGVARRRGGTGLGLSICKAIVEQHNGRIWVESERGKGSKFTFTIPLTEEA